MKNLYKTQFWIVEFKKIIKNLSCFYIILSTKKQQPKY